MTPHQQRVVDEKTELDDKIGKLRVFIESEVFKNLDTGEQNRLLYQKDAMCDYSSVLADRIAHF